MTRIATDKTSLDQCYPCDPWLNGLSCGSLATMWRNDPSSASSFRSLRALLPMVAVLRGYFFGVDFFFFAGGSDATPSIRRSSPSSITRTPRLRASSTFLPGRSPATT